MSKTQPVIPPPPPPPPPPPHIHLETIYEESGSSLSSSNLDIHHKSHNHPKLSKYTTNQTIHGLISARSIPSVDVHRRRRPTEYRQKPPIEVRHRDGTKHYIHPSLHATAMIINRRKHAHSSRHDPSLLSTTKINPKYRQILNTTPKKKKKLSKKTEILVTIITAEDLSQAGVTPTLISSPDESEASALIKSPSNSSLDTIKTVKNISLKDTVEVPIERFPIAAVPPSIHPVQPVIDISISNLRFPSAPRHHSQHPPPLRHPQQPATIRSQSLPPLQSHFPPSNQPKLNYNQMPPVAVVPPSPQKSLPSLQITLTSDKNEKNLSSKVKPPNTTKSSSKSNNEIRNSDYKQPFRPSNTLLVGGGSRSAFRPFLKPTTFNPQQRIPLNINERSQIATNQSTQNSSQLKTFPPSHPQQQQFRPTSLSSMTRFTLQPSTTINSVVSNRRSISSHIPKQSVNPVISNQILSDKGITSTSKMKTLNHSQQSAPISTTKMIDHSSTQTNKDAKSHLIALDSNIQWHSVTSKSLYDVPRLSHQYSDIPLRITIPDGTPTHNQKLVYKHDIALEKRLLDAGLSPETIALYERILEVADGHQIDISPPEIIDQYQEKLL